MPVFMGFSAIEIKKTYTYRRHQHNQYEVIIVDHGRYLCRLNDYPLRLKPGDLLIVKPGDWHEDTCRPPLKYFGFNFRFQPKMKDDPPPALFHETIAPHQQSISVNRSVMWPILDAIQQEARQVEPIYVQVQQALFLEFFWRMIRVLPADILSADFGQCARDQDFISQLSRLFLRHLHDKCSIRDMARSLGMSQSSFCHKSRRILGLSPVKALMKIKMDHALHFLTHTSMSIKEISADFGFENPYHFSRTFKKYTGRPPSSFR